MITRLDEIEQDLIYRSGGTRERFSGMISSIAQEGITQLVRLFRKEKFSDLDPTCKNVLGTVLETHFCGGFGYPAQINQQKGSDTYICSHPVAIKNTTKNQWMIRPTALGMVCMLFRVDIKAKTIDCGLIEVTPEVLSEGTNNDGKHGINKEARGNIRWMITKAPLHGKAIA